MIEFELNNFLYRQKYHEKYHEQAKIKRYEENRSPNLRCVQMVLLQYFIHLTWIWTKNPYPIPFEIRYLQKLASRKICICSCHPFFISIWTFIS